MKEGIGGSDQLSQWTCAIVRSLTVAVLRRDGVDVRSAAVRDMRGSPMDEMLTMNEAADLLDVPRSHIDKLVDNTVLRLRTVDGHDRFLATDVRAYQHRYVAEREAALNDLAQLDADLI